MRAICTAAPPVPAATPRDEPLDAAAIDVCVCSRVEGLSGFVYECAGGCVAKRQECERVMID